MKWSRLILVILFAAMTFGGTFTCTSGDDVKPQPQPQNPK